MARRYQNVIFLQRYSEEVTQQKADFNNVIEFKRKVEEKINKREILYFPTI